MCSYIIQKSVQPECLNMKATSSADINTPVTAEERSKLICRPKYLYEVMSAQMIYLHSITLISILLFFTFAYYNFLLYCKMFNLHCLFFPFTLYIFHLYCIYSICIVEILFVLFKSILYC